MLSEEDEKVDTSVIEVDSVKTRQARSDQYRKNRDRARDMLRTKNNEINQTIETIRRTNDELRAERILQQARMDEVEQEVTQIKQMIERLN